MKKILVLMMIFLATLLVSCDKGGLQENKYSFDLKLTSVTALRESVVYEYELVDEDNLLKNSEVKYSVVEVESSDTIKTGTLSFDEDDEEETKQTGSLTISSLTASTKYVVSFTAGYKGKNVLIVKNEITTSDEGTEENPYKISTADDLKNKIPNDREAHYILVNDIDLAGVTVNPLCKSSSAFKGVFDGNGKSIKNYALGTAKTDDKDATYASLSGQDGGLFGYIAESGVVKNVTFDNAQIYVSRSSKAHAAIVTGTNCGTIENVTVINSSINFKGNSNKEYYVATIAAYNADNGTITDCTVSADINAQTATGSLIIGGVFAYNEQNTVLPIKNIVDNCDYTGAINVTTSGSTTSNVEMAIGGIVGRNYSIVKNSNAIATIVVKAETKQTVSSTTDEDEEQKYRILVGGIVGHNVADCAVVEASSASASFDVDAKEAKNLYVGSVAGQNGAKTGSKATINNCTYTLPQDAANKVSAYKYEDADTVKCELIANNYSHASGNKTDAHSFEVSYYEYQEVEGKDELVKVGESVIINVATIQ